MLRFVFQKIKKRRFLKQPAADAVNGLIEKQHVKCAIFYHLSDVLQLRGIKSAMLLFFFLRHAETEFFLLQSGKKRDIFDVCHCGTFAG